MRLVRFCLYLVITALAVIAAGCGSRGQPPERAAHGAEMTIVEHRRPLALAADADGLWVLDERGRLARLNADGDLVVPPRPAAGPKLPRDVDALVRAGRDLWVADARRGLLRFDARTGRARSGSLSDARAVAVAVSGDKLWSVHDFAGTLRRLELSALRPSRAVRIGESLRGVAAAGSRVWTVDQDGGTLAAVDAKRLVPTRRAVADGTRPFHATAAGGRVWLSDDDGVTAYDAATLRRVGRWTSSVGSTPYAVADGNGAWAVSAIEPSLVRLDRSARVVQRIRLTSAGHSLAVGGGLVWIAGENVLHRITP